MITGIAMGAMGTDVAIENADVALIGDDLGHLSDTFIHARRARRIMAQNLALSGAILVSLVPLAAAGVLGLAAVVAIHELAEVVVILGTVVQLVEVSSVAELVIAVEVRDVVAVALDAPQPGGFTEAVAAAGSLPVLRAALATTAQHAW